MKKKLLGCQKKEKKKKKGGVKWDESNLEENERIKRELNPTKIDEPKTPYYQSACEDETDEGASLEMSPLSLSDDAGTSDHGRRTMGVRIFDEHLGGGDDEEMEDDEEEDAERKKKFVEARRMHYKFSKDILTSTFPQEEEEYNEEGKEEQG
mmetsp:Transcript_7247/g.14511  ORF Transcript_7247/g.14511 Transcript_7247/m.14511 type:complete len:152 (+) Transcript_7247:60-515(+)